ncbi:MAG TPA: A/G-specific adenine glycosylase [Deferrimonas sp.]
MTEDFSFIPTDVAPRLLAWYGREGRDLPWRGCRDPYRIWLSEIMLQQTTVAAVIPYYEKFLLACPDVATLAASSPEEVIALWAGLGYYSRARNLHAAARRIVADGGGAFPDDLAGLMALPGVGRSTAGAILSIAYDKKGVILDGNVRRVLCRLFAFEGDPRSAAAEGKLWGWAEAMTPEDRPHDYAQAIMDLGATLCSPKRPDCPRCPLIDLCRGRQLGLEAVLPAARAKRSVPEIFQVALLLERGGRFLVRRRPFSGLLGGLWEFPCREVAQGAEPAEVASALLAELGGKGGLRELGRIRHAYSHFRVEVLFYRGSAGEAAAVAETEGELWANEEELAGIPLHGAHKKGVPHLARDR